MRRIRAITFGLTQHIITDVQYSGIVATVIASAIIPTIIANLFFLPKHLLPKEEHSPQLPNP